MYFFSHMISQSICENVHLFNLLGGEGSVCYVPSSFHGNEVYPTPK